MAESVAVCFRSATWRELESALNAISHLDDARKCWILPKEGAPCVRMYSYNDLSNEYEDDALDRLVALLGDFPSSIVCIELSGIHRGCACNKTLGEIMEGARKGDHRFLDHYRPTRS